MENLWFKDVLGMYAVLRQALHGGIILFYRHNFSALSYSILAYFLAFACTGAYVFADPKRYFHSLIEKARKD